MIGAKLDFQRVRNPDGHNRVTFVELFFDLVFVFAITQLSHSLLEHLTPLGAVQTAMLFLAVWWAWIYTCWCTNWLDPERTPVRLMLLSVMLAGLVLSISLPEAFEGRGLAFGAAFALIQLGRTLFMLWAFRRHNRTNFLNFIRIAAWFVVSSALWLAGGFAEDGARMALWATAIAIEVAAPSLGYWTPGLGRSATTDWDVEAAHMAERCALFVIIALGESILVTGATAARLELTSGVLLAFVSAFVASVAMWWIYFDTAVKRASHRFEQTKDTGRIARLAYTYIHLPLVAGIVVSAVGDELTLAHPSGHIDVETIAVLVVGPSLYLVGNLLFRWATVAVIAWSHIAGLAALAVLAPLGFAMTPATFSAAVSVILVGVAASESIALRRTGAVA